MGLAGVAAETAGVEGVGSARLAGAADALPVTELLLGIPVVDHDHGQDILEGHAAILDAGWL